MVPTVDKHVHLSIVGASNMVIDATGVTMVCLNLTRAVNFKSCRNVTFLGLTVDYDPLPFTQGTVVGVSPQLDWVDVQLHAGYPQQVSSRFKKHLARRVMGGAAAIRAHLVLRQRDAHGKERAELSVGRRVHVVGARRAAVNAEGAGSKRVGGGPRIH